jgi:high-affinity K+ transport system ATPase subunit B
MNEKDALAKLFEARTPKERTESALKYGGIAALSVLALWGMRYSAISIGGMVNEGLVVLGAGALVAAFLSLFFGLRFPGSK